MKEMNKEITVTSNDNKNSTRGVTDMERLHFISLLAKEKHIIVSEYIKDAATEALAMELKITPDFIKRLEMSDRDVMEITRLVCRENSVRVSDFIRDAVYYSVANDICISKSHLDQMFNMAESWEPSWC